MQNIEFYKGIELTSETATLASFQFILANGYQLPNNGYLWQPQTINPTRGSRLAITISENTVY